VRGERGLPEAQLDAEDVVHETFEQMLLDRYPISSPPAWLYGGPTAVERDGTWSCYRRSSSAWASVV
jgi:hypothetical protein